MWPWPSEDAFSPSAMVHFTEARSPVGRSAVNFTCPFELTDDKDGVMETAPEDAATPDNWLDPHPAATRSSDADANAILD